VNDYPPRKELPVSRLGDQLMRIPIPGSEAGHKRAITMARAAVIEASASAPPARKLNLQGPKLRLALAMLLLALAVATPSGRTAISWAASLVGIGDVGGPPSIPQEFPSAPAAGDQVVVANGTAPDGTDYEIVAYESRNAGTCYRVDYPEQHADRSGGECIPERGLASGLNGHIINFVDQANLLGPDAVSVEGMLGVDVARPVRSRPGWSSSMKDCKLRSERPARASSFSRFCRQT
jgi:hypothetical protein